MVQSKHPNSKAQLTPRADMERKSASALLHPIPNPFYTAGPVTGKGAHRRYSHCKTRILHLTFNLFSKRRVKE